MDSKLNSIKQISIKEFLARRGIHPAKEHGYYGLYHSPIRKDSAPSFKVDYRANLWYDFGTGKGGSIVDFVMALEQCSMSKAIRILEEGYNTVVRIPVFDRSQPDGTTTEIIDIKRLQHPALLRYIDGRRINRNVAVEECLEVHYKRGGKTYFSVGFANNSDGWEFSNRFGKSCFSPKDITTRARGYDKVFVFEGFFDYLAYRTLKRGLAPEADVLVLNSVAMIDKALPFLRAHQTIMLALDNDDAGRKATEKIIQLLPTSKVVDYSSVYAPYKDLNDFLIAVTKR
jgi:DNA primase